MPTLAPSASPRPNRQRERTRRALVKAGQSLFASRSVDAVTIDEIVDTAEVGKGSFYNHFNDKDALAKAVFDSVQYEIEALVTARNAGVVDGPARIVRGFCVVLAYALEHPERLQALLSLSERRTAYRSTLNAGMTNDIQIGLDQGRLGEVSLQTGVLVVLGLSMIGLRHALSGDVVAPASDVAADLGMAMLMALGMSATEAKAIGREAADAIL